MTTKVDHLRALAQRKIGIVDADGNLRSAR
jgi:hypothetical protein